MRVKLAGSSEDGRGRVSEAKVNTRASFLKYNFRSTLLKSSAKNFIAGLVLQLLRKDHEGKALRKSW